MKPIFTLVFTVTKCNFLHFCTDNLSFKKYFEMPQKRKLTEILRSSEQKIATTTKFLNLYSLLLYLSSFSSLISPASLICLSFHYVHTFV